MAISRKQLLIDFLEAGYNGMLDHFEHTTLEEALFIPVGGYRSALGTLKHAAGWSHVYHSYAFEKQPRRWSQNDWPYGLRDTVEKSEAYLAAILDWFKEAHHKWIRDLNALEDSQVDEVRKLHWGEEAPLHRIVFMIAMHHTYHAGELNQVLSICRGEAWEEGEEVEENITSSIGYRVRPPWKNEKNESGES